MSDSQTFERCRAITFDVGGTLIEPYPSVGDIYARVARCFGLEAGAEVLTAAFYHAWREKVNFDYSRAAWSELVNASFRRSGQISTECFEAIYEEFERASAWRIYPDVFPVLEKLSTEKIPLGIISNWDERLRPLLEALKLSNYFEQIIISNEVGYLKPGREIFTAAVHAFGFHPHEILHIGDGPIEDFDGARQAGLNALLLNRSHGAAKESIHTLADLSVIMKRWF